MCLKKQMLQAMYFYALEYYEINGQPIEINAIAGSSHSLNSWRLAPGAPPCFCAPRLHAMREGSTGDGSTPRPPFRRGKW